MEEISALLVTSGGSTNDCHVTKRRDNSVKATTVYAQ
jgi:hypothetical protein